jgi:hypothetical protein
MGKKKRGMPPPLSAGSLALLSRFFKLNKLWKKHFFALRLECGFVYILTGADDRSRFF